MKRLALTAAALWSLTSTVALAEPAEPPITDPMSLVDTVTVDNVSKLVAELGAQDVKTQDISGTKMVTFMDAGVPYNLPIFLCDVRPGKCVALAMAVVVDPGATSYGLEALNEYNKNNPFLTAVKLDGNKIGLGRLWLVDGGVTKKNLAVNIASFIVNFRAVKLQPQVVASAQPPGAFRPTAYAPPLRFVPASKRDIEQLTRSLLVSTRFGARR